MEVIMKVVNNDKKCEFICQATKPKYEVMSNDINWDEITYTDNANNIDIVEETIFGY